MSKQTITVNGINYDAQTGLPVTASAKPQPSASATFTPRKPVHHSQSVHQTTAKSRTLNRNLVKKSTPAPTATKAPTITKFAPHPTTIKRTAPTPKRMDIAPMPKLGTLKRTPRAPKMTSPVIQTRTAATTQATPLKAAPTPAVTTATTTPVRKPATVTPLQAKAPQIAAPKPSQIIKQEAIAQALATPTKKDTTRRSKAAKKTRKHPRALSIASASLALLLLGGYFTYLNMPSLSVRVAAAQAGVNATYPGYHPDGYSVNGPVAYSQGVVSMKFAANGGSQSYTIEQTKKNWDSSAVLENYVKPKVGGSYIPYSERGLTIYTFNDSAAWVNNGILYTIDGDAPLSSDQILHIASSM